MTRASGALLALAIALEVTGTLALRLADGFSEPVWALVAITCYATSVAVFAQALDRGLGLGVGYGTLTAVGLMAAAVASVVVFDEGLSALHAVGLALLLGGTVLLQLRQRPAEQPVEQPVEQPLQGPA